MCLSLGVAIYCVVRASVEEPMCISSDAQSHHALLLQYARYFDLHGAAGLWPALWEFRPTWPPGLFFIGGVLAHLLSESPLFVRSLGLLCVPALVWSTYDLGRRLCFDRFAGVVAATTTLLSLGLIAHLREVSIDTWGAAAVGLSLSLLLRAAPFRRLGPTLLLGVGGGLCLLLRIQALAFTGPAVAFMVGRALWQAPSWRSRGRRAGRVALGLLVAVALGAPMWLPLGAKLLFPFVLEHFNPSVVPSGGDPSILGGLKMNLMALAHLGGWLPPAVAVVTLPRLLRRIGRGDVDPSVLAVVLLWLAGGVLGVAAVVSREPRYMVPALPAVAILATAGLRTLPARWWPRAASAMTGVVGLTALVLPQILPYDAEALPPTHGPWYQYVQGVGETRAQAQLVARARAGLERVLGDRPDGAGAYVIFMGERNNALLDHLVQHFPRLMFHHQIGEGLGEQSWHQQALRRRQVLILSVDWHAPGERLWRDTSLSAPIRITRVLAEELPRVKEAFRRLTEPLDAQGQLFRRD